MVLKPGSEARAEEIFRKWELDFAVIGKTTDTGRLVVSHKGEVEADLPVATLADSAPEYERPWVATTPPAPLKDDEYASSDTLLEDLKTMMGSPHLCSRRWIWEQYDHMVMGDTVLRPGGDAAVVRIHGTNKGVAVAADVTPRYCFADPVMGGRQAVAETWRNLTSVGAQPLAITDCMNFGNPERPEIMGQFVGCIEGMRDACSALDFPVVSGNVSLYNETNGVAIPPTPAIGGVGLIRDLSQIASSGLTEEGLALVAIGKTLGHLGQSLYVDILHDQREGTPPPVDLAEERKAGDFVRKLIADGTAKAVHDCSDGGLLVAIAEMALTGNIGAQLTTPNTSVPRAAYWFGEDQGRYVVAVRPEQIENIQESGHALDLVVDILGNSGGNELTLDVESPISIMVLKNAHEAWLPGYMAS